MQSDFSDMVINLLINSNLIALHNLFSLCEKRYIVSFPLFSISWENVMSSSFVPRMKQKHILLSQDGPHCNVVKFKPPMPFSHEDVDLVMNKLDMTLKEIETGETVFTVPTKESGAAVTALKSVGRDN